MHSTTFPLFNALSKSLYTLMAVACCQAQAKDPGLQKIHDSVMETISKAEEIPGLDANEFNSLKTGIIQRWGQLEENGFLVVTATDKETRPYFVAIQGIVEHVLSKELNKTITRLLGVIHTPMPATPLCTKGEVSQELVDQKIEKDPLRLFTVKARTTIVRDYLYQGGDLYVAYAKGGLGKRSEKQRYIYLQELRNYPAHLFDIPLQCQEIDPEVVGATYFFTTNNGKEYVFAIKMTQANDPQEIGKFGLWFGAKDHPAIQERISTVFKFLGEHGMTRLR